MVRKVMFLGRAALNALGERPTPWQGLDTWRETAAVPRHQSRSAALSGADRASPARGSHLSAFGEASGRGQGTGRVRQDLSGGDLVATTSTEQQCSRLAHYRYRR